MGAPLSARARGVKVAKLEASRNQGEAERDEADEDGEVDDGEDAGVDEEGAGKGGMDLLLDDAETVKRLCASLAPDLLSRALDQGANS